MVARLKREYILYACNFQMLIDKIFNDTAIVCGHLDTLYRVLLVKSGRTANSVCTTFLIVLRTFELTLNLRTVNHTDSVSL